MFEENNPFNLVVPATACSRCFDTGIWLTPLNSISVCPNLLLGNSHAGPHPAANMLRRATSRLSENGFYFHAQSFDVARILTLYSSAFPCSRTLLLETMFGETNMTEGHKLRKFHSIIEELRRVWLLPIGSRKNDPSGYWVITGLEDFKAWYKRTTAAPITQLSTIHKIAKHNFPVYAEQLELEFKTDLEVKQ